MRNLWITCTFRMPHFREDESDTDERSGIKNKRLISGEFLESAFGNVSVVF